MIVITLTKVPPSLRGDLTKWYQEIQTGVYVGSVSARIRDLLWDRIMTNIGNGAATMVYNTNNELGYQFRTTRSDRKVVDFDGIPLMMHLKAAASNTKHGFSDAAKFHKAKVMTQQAVKKTAATPVAPVAEQIIALDIETTGLNVGKDDIIAIGAVKSLDTGGYDEFYRLIRISRAIPKPIIDLTGISDELLQDQGGDLSAALAALQDFVKQVTIVGYNVQFDATFLEDGFRRVDLPSLSNTMVDLKRVVKKSDKFLDNYRLSTVLQTYGIENAQPHNALSDAKATLGLADKLIKKGVFKI